MQGCTIQWKKVQERQTLGGVGWVGVSGLLIEVGPYLRPCQLIRIQSVWQCGGARNDSEGVDGSADIGANGFGEGVEGIAGMSMMVVFWDGHGDGIGGGGGGEEGDGGDEGGVDNSV